MSSSNRPRVSLPPLERTGPIRNWSTLLGAGSSSRAGARPSGPIHDAVEAGYRVVDELIELGRETASQAHPWRWGPLGAVPEDLEQLGGRMAEAASELMMLWVRMMQQAAGGLPGSGPPGAPNGSPWGASFRPPPDPSSSDDDPWSAATPWSRPPWPWFPPMGPWSPPTEPPPSPTEPSSSTTEPPRPATASEGTRVRVSVRSRRKAEVDVDVRGGAASSSLVVHRLRPLDADPTIAPIPVQCRPDAATLCIELDVPDEQPAGRYDACIVDSGTGLPRGTLSLLIVASP